MADIKYYDVILKPVITEKSMNAMGEKKYTFLVHPEANKSQIKEAVEDYIIVFNISHYAYPSSIFATASLVRTTVLAFITS